MTRDVLAFLEVDPSAGNAVGPIAPTTAARLQLRDGWRIAASFGDAVGEARAVAETAGVADLSHLSKLEVGGPPRGELGRGRREDGAWWCPITMERQLVVGDAAAVSAVADREPAALDVTASLGALAVAGPLAREVFARFCALDLRDRVLPVGGFAPGSVARTPGFVLREATDRFLVLFGAAYGQYLWEVVTDAATHLGGRAVGVDALVSEEAVHA